jgi:hypothetical protein
LIFVSGFGGIDYWRQARFGLGAPQSEALASPVAAQSSSLVTPSLIFLIT